MGRRTTQYSWNLDMDDTDVMEMLRFHGYNVQLLPGDPDRHPAWFWMEKDGERVSLIPLVRQHQMKREWKEANPVWIDRLHDEMIAGAEALTPPSWPLKIQTTFRR